jgi:SAM-dependent methyltransferase
MTTATSPSTNPGAPSGPAAAPARPHLDERPDYTPRYPAERFIVPLLKREIEARFRTSMPKVTPGDRALDVGCGRQPFRREIEGAGLRYVGLDTQQNPDCPVDVVAPIDGELPAELLALGPFMFILCTEVLEHVAGWDAAFANFSRLLAPGGRVLLTCPAVYALHEEPYDFWRPTNYAIEAYARRHGLRAVEVARLGTGWDVLGTVISCMLPAPRRGVIGGGVMVLGFKALKRAVLAAMVRGWPQKLLDMGGGLYQSNLAVLEKP